MDDESSGPDVMSCQDNLLFYDFYYKNTYPWNIVNAIVEIYSVIHVYVLAFFTFLDFFSNMLFIIVLSQKELRSSGINLTMIMIAGCNFILAALQLIKEIFEQVNYLSKSYVEAVYGRAELYLSVYLSAMSDFLVVEMSFCRVMALFTSDSEKWRGRKHALVIAIILWIIVGIASGAIIPMTTVKLSDYSMEYMTTISNSYIENKCIIFRVTIFFFGTAFGVTPCILNFLFFMMIFYKLKLFEAHRKKIHSKQKLSSIDHSSRMLQAVLIMFLLIKTPEALLTIFNSLFMIDYYAFIAPKVTEFMEALEIFNASTSFIIYCTMSSRFREVFTRLFIPKVIQRRIHHTETIVVTVVATSRRVVWQ